MINFNLMNKFQQASAQPKKMKISLKNLKKKIAINGFIN